MPDFSDKIKTLLESRNMNQLQASKVFEVSHPAVAGWLKGAVPRSNVLKRIADYFEIELKVLTDNTRELPKKFSPKAPNGSTLDENAYREIIRSVVLRMDYNSIVDITANFMKDGNIPAAELMLELARKRGVTDKSRLPEKKNP